MIDNFTKNKIKKDILDKLSEFSLEELGNIQNKFGKKYKNRKVKDIYNINSNYILWIMSVDFNSMYINEYKIDEYSRQALILYYESMEFLKNKLE